MNADLLARAQQLLPTLPPAARDRVGALVAEARKVSAQQFAGTSFMEFVKYVWPGFIHGAHHERIARMFERIAEGKQKRLIINLPPRHSKSEFASYLLPGWFLGKYPEKKIIQASHTAELAVGFGRKVRNLVDSERYKDLFPGVGLQVDSKAAGRWSTNKGGEYFAIGVGGAVTGKGADLLIIDDPHALEISTEIPTPDGFRTVAELRLGDFVFGPDGEPVLVLGKSEVQHDRRLYRVTTDDGEVVYCDGGHLWSYRTDTKLSAGYRTATARELSTWGKPSLPCMPRHAPAQYLHKELPVDPYVLGAWLGDGTTGLNRMTAHPDDAGFVRAQFEEAGFKTTSLTDPYSFGVKGLRRALRAAGVLYNKHIPEQYFTASAAQRTALVQGLMDTDGTVTAAGQCSFQNTNKELAKGFRELLHSLGVKAKLCVYFDARSRHRTRKLDYRVNFKLQNAARMPRKQQRTYTPTDKRCRSFSVEKTELRGSVQCITVARDDGLFLAGRGYVVTHNSEQEAALAEVNPEIYDKTYEWYTSGPRQRLQPGGSILIVQTRWSKRDLTAQVLKAAAQRGGDDWEVIEFPALFDSGEPLWPQFWSKAELDAIKQELPNSKWMAQYQQNPTSEVSAIVKREWWKPWERSDPPQCDFTLMSWDTAFEKSTRADYSACTLWGVFYRPDDTGVQQANIILINAFRARMEFPELKKKAIDQWKEWQPDAIIIEKKASGAPLIYEMRAMGIPVQEYTPTRGNDKISRLNSISDVFASGRVWAPETHWAEEVIDEVASFPAGEHDDYVDSVSLAMMRFRQGGYIRTLLDEADEPLRRHTRNMLRNPYY